MADTSASRAPSPRRDDVLPLGFFYGQLFPNRREKSTENSILIQNNLTSLTPIGTIASLTFENVHLSLKLYTAPSVTQTNSTEQMEFFRLFDDLNSEVLL